MDDFPAKIADFLEETAGKIRTLTVDRVADVVKWIALGIVLAAIGTLVLVFLLVGLFRIISELIGVTATYAILGGLFVIVGLFIRSRRFTADDTAS